MTIEPLSPEHRQALEQGSAISPAVIAARGYRTVTSKKELVALGFAPVQCRVPGLLIPLYGPDGKPAGYQFRPDVPRAQHGLARLEGLRRPLTKHESAAKGGRQADVSFWGRLARWSQARIPSALVDDVEATKTLSAFVSKHEMDGNE